jgi:hypothetical protein
MGEALKRGMVLVMSLWDDHEANMSWLDSNYPTDADPNTPGAVWLEVRVQRIPENLKMLNLNKAMPL